MNCKNIYNLERMGSDGSSGEGEHGVRPYNIDVGASDLSPTGADLWSRNSMFALHFHPRRLS
jgi:hypothetical protein